MERVLTKATDLAKLFMKRIVSQGDIVVDATVGNGNDTLFLAELVGQKGKVYGFDIQKKALEKANQRIKKNGLNDRVKLIQDGHENIDKYIDTKVKGIMYNLGYLPGENKIITTKAYTTIISIGKALELLDKGGGISICIYTGHEEGAKECVEIINYLEKIDQSDYNIVKLEFINQKNNPPKLVLIEKR